MADRSFFADIKGGDRAALAGAAAAFLTLVVYTVYGAVFRYFDMTAFTLLLCSVVFEIIAVAAGKKGGLIGIFKLLAAIGTAGAFAMFFYNSFPVWADELNNITMYSSRGGLVPVIALCVLFLGSLISQIISCFMSDNGGAQ